MISCSLFLVTFCNTVDRLGLAGCPGDTATDAQCLGFSCCCHNVGRHFRCYFSIIIVECSVSRCVPYWLVVNVTDLQSIIYQNLLNAVLAGL